MILEEDSLLKFSYDPSTDILTVRFPDGIGTPVSQIENSLQKLARNVAQFDIKKLLLDLSSGVPGLDEANYRELVMRFSETLNYSRLKKVARVIPEDPARTYLIEHFAEKLTKDLGLSFSARSFSDKTDAIEWLNQPEI